MLERLKTCLTIASFALLIALCGLWISDHVVILRTVRFADSRSHLYIHHGAIQLDCTGLTDSLRDFRYCQSLELSLGQLTDLPAHELATTSADDMWTFRATSRYVMRTPLQGMVDGEGKQIYTEQSLPMQLITLPAWLVAAMLAVMPIRGAINWIRQPREEWRRWNPIAIIARRYALLAVFLSVMICIGWTAGQMRHIRLLVPSLNPTQVHQISFSQGDMCHSIGDRHPKEDFEQDAFRSASLLVLPLYSRVSTRKFLGAMTIGDNYLFSIPYWLLLIGTLSVPLTALLMRVWGKRLRPGHCVECDYDLRASTRRCPECGREIDAVVPRILKPVRRQIVFFGLSTMLLLGTCVLGIAWYQSMSWPCILFGVLHKVGSGDLAIESGNVVITASGAPSGPMKSLLPIWPFIVVLAGASGGLLWAGRRIGWPHKRN